MVSSSSSSSSSFGPPLMSPPITLKPSSKNFRNLPLPRNNLQQVGPTKNRPNVVNYTCKTTNWVQKSAVPLAASIAVLLCSSHANAGILSGFPGIQSTPGPELPKVEFLSEFNEKNQKFYAENDKRFQDSPLLKELLERSKLNKEKNKQAILDKYCIRGAEWGVGDCSAEGMTPQERDEFIASMKKKAGIE